jgi:vacuolar-type H+-ATPase subunit F/Vma7
MSRILAIAKDATALKLTLAGLVVEETEDVKVVEKRFETALKDNLQLLILDERYREEFSERMVERLKRHTGEPLVVFCPYFDKEDSEVDAYLSSVLRPAIGFEIRLE